MARNLTIRIIFRDFQEVFSEPFLKFTFGLPHILDAATFARYAIDQI